MGTYDIAEDIKVEVIVEPNGEIIYLGVHLDWLGARRKECSRL